ncbi:TPA: hypothetical protein QEM49_005816, partial [Pseudomonas putida]|nr:hypothetical protein [Pseudomonas putida]
MAYDTLNPLGSSDPRDLFDNASAADRLINSTADMIPNRFGQNLYTWSFFHRLTATALAQINVTIGSAQTAVDAARDAGIQNIQDSVDS